jgi:hypothetical protein
VRSVGDAIQQRLGNRALGMTCVYSENGRVGRQHPGRSLGSVGDHLDEELSAELVVQDLLNQGSVRAKVL